VLLVCWLLYVLVDLDHFTVVFSVTWPLNGSETGGACFDTDLTAVVQVVLMLTRCKIYRFTVLQISTFTLGIS